MKHSPFSRARAMMALIASYGVGAALAQMGEYISRGHGQNKPSGKGMGNSGTNWLRKTHGEPNGERELARRVRQLKAGIIHLN